MMRGRVTAPAAGQKGRKAPCPACPAAQEEEEAMTKRKVLQCTREGQPIKLYGSIREAEREHRISHISSVCRGKRRSDGGYIWRYAEELT